jgi:hypothetical protein
MRARCNCTATSGKRLQTALLARRVDRPFGRRLSVGFLATAASVAALAEWPGWIRTPLGLALVLLLPGLALLELTHPDVRSGKSPSRRSLVLADRILLGALLSVIVSVCIGLVLVSIPFGLTRASAAVTLGSFTVGAIGLSLVVGVVESSQSGPALPERSAPRVERGSLEWVALALAIALGVAVAAAAGVRLAEAVDRHHSTLAFDDPAPLDCFPLVWEGSRLLHNGTDCPQPANLTVFVSNHEGRSMHYSLEVLWSQTPGADVDSNDTIIDILSARLPPVQGTEPQYRWNVPTAEPPWSGRVYLKLRLYDAIEHGAPLAQLQLRVDKP